MLLQDSFFMDFVYKGKLYPETEFLLYIAHCKVDNEEASKFCGQYSSKTQGIAQICRECHVPTALSGRCLVNYPPKLKEEIRTLVENNDENGLKKLSQHNFANAFWKCHFGQHNEAGIHGACMLDILHTLYLGIFLRVRDAFFAQVGPTSQTATELDALAKEYGVLLERQSERDLPKSKFSKGIMGGKLMAKEYVKKWCTKYTSPDTGSKKWGGWNKAGMEKFIELCTTNRTARVTDTSHALEVRALELLKTAHDIEDESYAEWMAKKSAKKAKKTVEEPAGLDFVEEE